MKFITAEQFSKADKKVRDNIMEWWEPSTGDLIVDNYKIRLENSYVDMLTSAQIRFGRNDIIKDCETPCLTVGQLIEFIEWKTKELLTVNRCIDSAYSFNVWSMNGEFASIKFMVKEKGSLIDGLWKTAQNVCE